MTVMQLSSAWPVDHRHLRAEYKSAQKFLRLRDRPGPRNHPAQMTKHDQTLPEAAPLPYVLTRPTIAPGLPLIIASPHSGRLYPADLLAASRLDPLTLRRSEDAFMDELVGDAPDLGATVLCASYARAYIDLNREPDELDPAMFADPLPRASRRATERLSAGLGAVPRVVGLGLDIYARKLTLAEADQRVASVHQPYHAALQGLIDSSVAAHGYAVLLDCHSMPSLPAGAPRERAGAPAQIVLGDRNGLSCHPALTGFMRDTFQSLGFKVAINAPYAGGYTTEHYGQPALRRHVLQIEVDRGLYMDELAIARKAGFDRMRQAMRLAFEALTQALGSLPLGRIPLGEGQQLAAE